MVVTQRQDTNLLPAMAVAALLHVLVFALTLVSWPQTTTPLSMGGATTVTIVDASAADVSTAFEAPEPAPATTETPVLDAPPEMVAPQPAPTPTPPPPAKATPTPVAKPTPTPPVKGAGKPQQKPAQKQQSSDDFLASLSSLSQTKAGGARRSGAQKGANRAQTDTAARTGQGAAAAALADATALMKSRLMRAWRPNCGVEGADKVVVRVQFRLLPNGELDGAAKALNPQGGAVWQAAATRAESAVGRAAPFTELPKDQYARWKDWTVDFNGETACRYQ